MSSDPGKSLQEYIDECPVWSDGTRGPAAPLTVMQRRIWWLAAAGKFFEGLVVFMTGVALPLIIKEFSLGPAESGVVSAASLAGILIGATVLGGLADRFGRRLMFIVEMVLFVVFLVLLALSPGYPWLVVCLFGLGLALGCDYPTAHMIISESIASRSRGRLVLAAFGFQALGALAGTGVGFLVLRNVPEIQAWRWMYASAIVPAAGVLLGRFFITESPHWLLGMGRAAEAKHAAARLLLRDPPYPKAVVLRERGESPGPAEGGYAALFTRHRRAVVLASVPWFLQDLATYGIGIFTPTILAHAFGHQRPQRHQVADVIHADLAAAQGAAFIDLLLIVGIVCAVLLADRVGRIRLQVLGFLGCAAGLLLASLAEEAGASWKTLLIFAGFMLFSFMTNVGPNAQTYLLSGEVFPTLVRGKGAGFAASFAKIGAVLTAFLFPVLLADLGTQLLLWLLVAASLAGAAVTWQFRIETTGKNLEETA